MVVHKTVTNSDAESEAPKIKTAIPEDFDQPNEDEVPEFGNAEAPRYSKGEAQLTPNAIRCRAKRIFTPRVDGSKKVSDTIFKEWQQKGAARKNLEEIFKQCGYDAESCHIVFCSDSRVYSSLWRNHSMKPQENRYRYHTTPGPASSPSRSIARRSPRSSWGWAWWAEIFSQKRMPAAGETPMRRPCGTTVKSVSKRDFCFLDTFSIWLTNNIIKPVSMR